MRPFFLRTEHSTIGEEPETLRKKRDHHQTSSEPELAILTEKSIVFWVLSSPPSVPTFGMASA